MSDSKQKTVTAGRTLALTIISAQQLQPTKEALASRKSAHHDVVDPYVHVKVFGAPSDDAAFTTRAIDNNLYDPYWNESAKFDLLYPPLDLVQLLVLDDDVVHDDFLGQAVIPVLALTPGYHHIQLYDRSGTAKTGSSVFLKVRLAPLDVEATKAKLCEVAEPGLARQASSRRRRRSSLAQIIHASGFEMAPTGVSVVDTAFERCNDVVGEIGRLKQELERAHEDFLLHAGAKPDETMASAIRTLTNKLKGVSFVVRESGNGVSIDVSCVGCWRVLARGRESV